MTTRTHHGLTVSALKRNAPDRFRNSVRRGGYAKRGKRKHTRTYLDMDYVEFVRFLEKGNAHAP